jgi:adenylate cyclase
VDLLHRLLKHIFTSLCASGSRLLHDRRVYARLQYGSALGLGIGLLIAVAIFSGILGTAPARLSDFLYQPSPPTGQVVIVAIDDSALREVGAWPWSRTTIAALVDALVSAQPRVIALDLILPEPASDDVVLAAALQRAPMVIQPIIGVEATRYPVHANSFPRFDFVLSPAQALQTPTTRLGHRLIAPDADGVVRQIAVAIEFARKLYPAVGIAALEAIENRPLDTRIEENKIGLGGRRLPVDDAGRMRITFANPTMERVISARDILRGRADLAALRDKIVLIGLMSSTTPEHFVTPLSPNRRTYSVEIQANVVETILGKYFLVQQDRLTEIVMVFLLAILAGATLPHFRALTMFALTIIYFLLYLGYAFQKFNDGILVQPLYPILALVGVLIGATIFRHFSQERQRETIMRLFRRYVAPEAVDQVTSSFDEGALPLGGARRVVSVVCVDQRDLTRLAGELSPATLFDAINQYAALIVAIVFRGNGAVTKHTGEEIMATWNLLSDQPNHARQALSAAMEIKREIGEYAKKQPKELAIKVGIGIATGGVIAGRIGVAAHADYTIVGEIISVAERLAAKPERSVFIDAATFAHVGEEFQTRQVKPIKLRRETDPQQVWQVLMPTELEEEPEIVQRSPDVQI